MRGARIAVAAAASLAVPAVADALEIQDGVTRTLTFKGSGCGSVQARPVAVPAGVRRIRISPIAPPAVDAKTGQPVARINGRLRISGSDRTVLFTATGSDDVCARPATYPGGWITRPVTVSFGFLKPERVFFRSFNDRGTTRSAYRPPLIRFGKRASVTAVRWVAWDGARARGNGRLQIGARDLPVRVSLQEAWGCHGQVRYLLLRVRVVGRLPIGTSRRYSERFGCF